MGFMLANTFFGPSLIYSMASFDVRDLISGSLIHTEAILYWNTYLADHLETSREVAALLNKVIFKNNIIIYIRREISDIRKCQESCSSGLHCKCPEKKQVQDRVAYDLSLITIFVHIYDANDVHRNTPNIDTLGGTEEVLLITLTMEESSLGSLLAHYLGLGVTKETSWGVASYFQEIMCVTMIGNVAFLQSLCIRK